jgi:hypothetical protein
MVEGIWSTFMGDRCCFPSGRIAPFLWSTRLNTVLLENLN